MHGSPFSFQIGNNKSKRILKKKLIYTINNSHHFEREKLIFVVVSFGVHIFMHVAEKT